MDPFWQVLLGGLPGGAAGSGAVGALVLLLLRHRLDRQLEALKGDIAVATATRKRRDETVEKTARSVLAETLKVHDFVMKGLAAKPDGDASPTEQVAAYYEQAMSGLATLRALGAAAEVDLGGSSVIALLTYANTVSVHLNDFSLAILSLGKIESDDILAAEINRVYVETIQQPLMQNAAYRSLVLSLRGAAQGET